MISPNHQSPRARGNLSRLTIGRNAIPFDLGYIGTQLQNNGDVVKLLFANRYNFSHDQIQKQINDFNPDIIGITSSSGYICPAPSIQPTMELVDKIRKVGGNPKIIILGGIASLFEKELLNAGADVVIRKEPELKFIEVTEHIENLEKIKGISYRQNNHIISNEDDDKYVDLNQLPPIDYHLFNTDHLYIEFNPMTPDYKLGLKRITTIETNRGCPFRCSFCYQYHRGHKVRHKNIEKVIKEIKYYHSEFGVNLFYMPDNTFTINRDYVINLCESINKLPFKIHWRVVTRADYVDIELLKKMKEAGCFYIAFGLESSNNQILQTIKKKNTAEDIEKAALICKETGIDFALFSLLFLPGDTIESINKTIQFAARLKPMWIGTNVATPIPGTELYQMGLAEGKIKGDRERLLEECIEVAGTIGTKFTSEQVEEMYQTFRRKLLFINLSLHPFNTIRYTFKSLSNPKQFYQFGKDYFFEFKNLVQKSKCY